MSDCAAAFDADARTIERMLFYRRGQLDAFAASPVISRQAGANAQRVDEPLQVPRGGVGALLAQLVDEIASQARSLVGKARNRAVGGKRDHDGKPFDRFDAGSEIIGHATSGTGDNGLKRNNGGEDTHRLSGGAK